MMKYVILRSRVVGYLNRTERDFRIIIDCSPRILPIYYYNQTGKQHRIDLPSITPIGKAYNLEFDIGDDIYKSLTIKASVEFFDYDDIKKKLLHYEHGCIMNSATVLDKEFYTEKILFVEFGPKEYFRG